MEALMRDSAWTDKARVFACLSLHTMAFQCEEATKLNKGKRIPLTRGDIADDTGLDVSRVRKAVVSLEHEGYLERRAPNGLVRGEITIHCWAVPRLNGVEAAQPKTQTRFDLPTDLPPYLTRWMRRFKVAAVTPLMLERALPICENLDRWEGELRGILKPEIPAENGAARSRPKKQGTGLRASTSGGSAQPFAYNKERARNERKGKIEEIPSSSSSFEPENQTTMTAELEQVSECLAMYCRVETAAVQTLVSNCHAKAHGATVAAICDAIHLKGPMAPKKDNPLGFLMVAVPNALMGAGRCKCNGTGWAFIDPATGVGEGYCHCQAGRALRHSHGRG
jgi:hypothetical protein